jgi:putative ABC transport system permease protein
VTPFIWAHLRGRTARSVALLLGILLATTGFTVLTGATGTARLQVTGEVDRTAQAAYQILVRPRGARTPLETDRQKVRPNSLSGIYGGLTQADYGRIRDIPGIDVAAPIAMAGYANASVGADLDLTGLVDRSLDRQVIRLDRTFLADRGLSSAPGRPLYVYVTKHAISWPITDGYGPTATFTGGETYPGKSLCDGAISVLEDGRPVCSWITQSVMSDLLTDRQWTSLDIARLTADGRFEYGDPAQPQDRLLLRVRWHVPMLLAAVDPEAEDRLAGLRGAVTAGRYLQAGEQPKTGPADLSLPVISAGRADQDDSTRVTVTRVPLGAPPPGSSTGDALTMLDGLGRPGLANPAVHADPPGL